jgi:hypothetical protein
LSPHNIPATVDCHGRSIEEVHEKRLKILKLSTHYL